MGPLGRLRFSRSQFVRAIDGLCRKKEINRTTLDALVHDQEKICKIDRANFWAKEKNAALKAKVELLETHISYVFRNPWHAKQAIMHSSLNCKTDPSPFTCFETLEFQGDGVMRRAAKWLLTNTGPHVSSSPKHPEFSSDSINNAALATLIETMVSNDYLARVGAKLKLWDSLHFAPSDEKIDVSKVEEFLVSVQEDRYDVSAPEILADAVEATAGAVYGDSDSIEVFTRVWESLFFFEENPMYKLLTTPRPDLDVLSPVFRQEDDKITFVLLSHDPSRPLPSAPVVLGSGFTKLAAVVDALDRTP